MWKDIPIQWINISISSHLSFCMCVRTVRFYPLSEFQLYKTALLNIVTTFYTRPQSLFILPLTPVPFDHPLLVSPVQELALFSSVSVSLVSRGCSICGSSDFVCTRAQSCLTLWPHGLRPVRLLCPWDSPGKNSGGGCHFLLRGPSRPRGWSGGLPDPGLSPHLLSLQASTVEGLPFPPRGTSRPGADQGAFPTRGWAPPPEPTALAARFLATEPPGKPWGSEVSLGYKAAFSRSFFQLCVIGSMHGVYAPCYAKSFPTTMDQVSRPSPRGLTG